MSDPEGAAIDEEICLNAVVFTTATCQRLQKSAKADVLFIMLLVKQHYKIGICFASATRGNLLECGCIHNRSTCQRLQKSAKADVLFIMCQIRGIMCLYELFSSSFSLRAFQVKSSQITINQ